MMRLINISNIDQYIIDEISHELNVKNYEPSESDAIKLNWKGLEYCICDKCHAIIKADDLVDTLFSIPFGENPDEHSFAEDYLDKLLCFQRNHYIFRSEEDPSSWEFTCCLEEKIKREEELVESSNVL